MKRIYLDNAATTWPKPESVYEAAERQMREVGAAAGRSAYRRAGESGKLVTAARRELASLLGAADERSIAFALNGTDALNLAIHGLLDHATDRPHVVTTAAEHNSVLRPLRHLADAGRIDLSHVPCDSAGLVEARQLAAALTDRTRLVAITHASNVTGALQSVVEIGELTRARDEVVLLVDAAQTIGHVPIDVQELGIDLLAAPGHKGLFGPLGTGLLYVRPGVERLLHATRQGGTGSASHVDRQPDEMPDKLEAGNLNVPGIAGLLAGARFVRERGIENIRRHDMELTARLGEGLAAIDGVTVYGPRQPRLRVGVVSIAVDGYDPQEVAGMLDSAYGIEVRSGIHCAGPMHEALGTIATGGTVRLSTSALTSAGEIDAAIAAVAEIAAEAMTV